MEQTDISPCRKIYLVLSIHSENRRQFMYDSNIAELFLFTYICSVLYSWKRVYMGRNTPFRNVQ